MAILDDRRVIMGSGYTYSSINPVEYWLIAVSCILVIINDVYMLTLDMKRSYTYMGCIGTQVLISAFSLVTGAVVTIHPPSLYPAFGMRLVYSLCILWSFGLIITLLPAAISLRAREKMNWVKLWKLNTKDTFLGVVKCPKMSRDFLSIMGLPRNTAILHRQVMSISGHGISRLFRNLLFRRISPVETKGYALARNGFALIAMGILVFRTITALTQAQNKIGIRISSRDCMRPNIPKFQILMQFGSTGSKGSNENIKVEVWEEFNKTVDACNQVVTYNEYPRYSAFSLLLYTCNSSRVNDWEYWSPIYRILARSGDGSDLDLADMPLIWLLDEAKNFNDVFNPKPDPEYTYVSLHPIDASATYSLQNATTATARIHVTLKPEMRYLRDKTVFDAVKSGSASNRYIFNPGGYTWECYFVEDYRSGTILDILGSVGGLFAILQTLHVLLFGRPLFWGLLGTKSINPFGLLGSLGPKSFRRRLHEEYGRESTKDNPDWIRTAAFLRDFVIDFGPLENQLDRDRDPKQVMPVGNRNGTADSRVPLMLICHHDSPSDARERDLDFPLALPASSNSICQESHCSIN
ncbi:hypothetical protein OPQ81_001039 [Rhizoctonia solani]|nr:hypothetical protein OPQ81_001039 [Rhizoctonia solani]